jgi:dnd system-associated protein 4
MAEPRTEVSDRDRFYVQKDKHPLFQRLSQGEDAPFKTMKDVWVLAATLGVHFGRRSQLRGGTQHVGFWHYLSLQEDIPVLQAIAVAEEGDVRVLGDRSKVIKIAEEYANGGIDFLVDATRADRDSTLISLASLVVKEADVEKERDTTVDDLVAKGESRSQEFKSSMKWDYKAGNANKELTKEVVRTVAAFLNGDGGTLLIGVKDNGDVLGIEKDIAVMGNKGIDAFQLTFAGAVKTFLGDDIGPLLRLEFAKKGGKTVAVVSCPPCHRPVFVKEETGNEFYARSASSSQRLDAQATNSYINSRWPKS